jgi:hypothetical protein
MESPSNEKKDIILTITFNDEGIRVDGPIKNKPIVLFMLEKAKDVIKAHNILAAQPKIQKPGGILNFVRRH